MRLSQFTAASTQAEFEATQMVTEKVEALLEAQVAGMEALEQGRSFFVAAERTYAPFCQRVRREQRALDADDALTPTLLGSIGGRVAEIRAVIG